MGTGIGQGKAVGSAVEGISRNPGASDYDTYDHRSCNDRIPGDLCSCCKSDTSFCCLII
jgi:hypothetical protein